MLGENEDSYVQSYIQTQSMGIACETLLTLQLLERRENGEQLTIAEGGNYGNAGLLIRPRVPALRNVTSHWVRIKMAGLVRLTWIKGDLKNEWVDFYHCRVVVFTHCQHTFMSKSGFCILGAL